jgi:hypothetical protein
MRASLVLDASLDKENMTFPIRYMPQCIREAVDGIGAYTNAPPELTASVALGVAAFACQGLWNATAHRFDCNTSMFILVLNESGGLKSEISKILNVGRTRAEEIHKQTYKTALARYKAQVTDWELQRKEALKETNPLLRLQTIEQLELNPPRRPFNPSRVVEAPTVVGLTRAFQQCGPSLGLFSTDAGTFLSGTAMSDPAQGRQMVAMLSKIWSGESYDRLTGDDQVFIENKRATILWLVQGVMANDFLSNPAFAGQGILGRMLVIKAPRYMSPMATYADDREQGAGRAKAMASANAFNTRIYELLMRDMVLKEGTVDELDPPPFPWAPDTLRMQQDWVNEYCEPRRNRSDPSDDNLSYYQRIEEHCTRLATVMAIIDGRTCVEKSNAIAAQKLMEWVTEKLGEIDKSALPDSEETRAYEALKVFLMKHKGEVVRLRDANRNARAAFAKAPERVRNAVLRKARDEGLCTEQVETAGNGNPVAVIVVSGDEAVW